MSSTDKSTTMRTRKKITSDFLADLHSHQSQEHDALKQKMAAEGDSRGQARNRELPVEQSTAPSREEQQAPEPNASTAAAEAKAKKEQAAREKAKEERLRDFASADDLCNFTY